MRVGEVGSPTATVGDGRLDVGDGELEAIEQAAQVEYLVEIAGHGCCRCLEQIGTRRTEQISTICVIQARGKYQRYQEDEQQKTETYMRRSSES